MLLLGNLVLLELRVFGRGAGIAGEGPRALLSLTLALCGLDWPQHRGWLDVCHPGLAELLSNRALP